MKKSRFFKLFTGIVILAGLTGCAGTQTIAPQGNSAEIQAEQQKQKALAYRSFIDTQVNIYRVAFPILTKNTEFCGKTIRPVTGLNAWNIDTVPGAYKTAAVTEYNLGPDLILQNVIKNSPADRAGLRAGDLILSINGQPVPRGEKALKTAQDLITAAGDRPIDIAYIRNNTPKITVLQPVMACNYPVLLENSSTINAYADGQKIVVSRGITRFTENDNELALVIAHELAHNTMNHVEKLKQNVMVGSLGGLAVDALLGAAGVNTGNQFSRLGGTLGQQRYSVPFEQEADYIGMYYMSRAGYATAGVADFWRRMAAEGAASVDMRTTHPTSSERFIAIEQTHAEINAKKQRGQKLSPNFTQN